MHFREFTPKKIIKELIESINENRQIIKQYGSFIAKNITEACSGNSKEYMGKAFKFKNDEIVGCYIPNVITGKGIEDILVDLNILIRKEKIIDN